MDNITFTAHNIRLDDGLYTISNDKIAIHEHGIFRSAKRIINALFAPNLDNVRLVDLGCLEGGYAVEFARLGLHVTGIDVRQSNIDACNYVKSRINVKSLTFIRDNAWQLSTYGPFDVVFCAGVFYHIENPRQFMGLLFKNCKKLLFLETHFSTWMRNETHNLSDLAEHEGYWGRWATEFGSEQDYHNREIFRWASWDNIKSFWLKKEYILQAMTDAGFDIVLEQFDHMMPNIADSMENGFYKIHARGVFVGIKNNV